MKRKADKISNKDYYQALKEFHICVICKKDAPNGRIKCNECREKARLKAKSRPENDVYKILSKIPKEDIERYLNIDPLRFLSKNGLLLNLSGGKSIAPKKDIDLLLEIINNNATQ